MLLPGVVLDVGASELPMSGVDVAPVPDPETGDVTVLVMPRPRLDWFADQAWASLVEQSWTVTSDSNRVGLRLEGGALARNRPTSCPARGWSAGRGAPTSSLTWSLLAWAGLWLPGLVDFFTQAFHAAGVEVSTTWLLIPLCAPTGLSAVLVPALTAAVTCLGGLLGAVVTRRGWSWVVAAWLAPWVHYLAFFQLSHEFAC